MEDILQPKKNQFNIIKQCREEGLPLWECPNFLFLFTGVISVVSMGTAYLLASYYFPPEIVIVLIGLVSFVMVVISYLVNQGIVRITQSKKELRKSNEALSIALTEIRKEKKMRENFTTMLVHDLRSPLEAVRLIIELLQEKKVSLSSKDLHDSLMSINHSVANILNLITNLLDITKFERGRFLLHKRIDDIQKIITLQIENFKILALSKGVKLSSQLADNLPSLLFDEYALDRALANLIVNAIKFTPAKGEIIVQAVYVPKGKEVEKIAKHYGIKWFINSSSPSIASISNSVLVAVTDNGIGIPKDKLDKLFFTFSQVITAQGTVKTGIPLGTGLGLSIAKAIIQAHRGIIGVFSQENQGSSFYFSIPTA